MIFSHKDCSDGLLAAYSAPKQEVHFLSHSEKDLTQIQNRFKTVDPIIYCLDFSFSKDVFDYFFSIGAKKIIVIDHHKTAVEDSQADDQYLPFYVKNRENIEYHFDQTKSGAVLAYEYFHKKEPPLFFKMVEDRDLWRWQVPNSKAFTTTFFQKVKTLDDCQKYFPLEDPKTIEENTQLCIENGNNILDYMSSLVKEIAKNKVEISVIINGIAYKGYAVNSSVLNSETGNYLSYLDGSHFALIYDHGDLVRCSLRSREEFDCSVIAKYFGGGGHKNASGFVVPNVDFFDVYKQFKIGFEI